MIGARFILTYYQDRTLNELMIEQEKLQTNIDLFLNTQETVYYRIDEIIPHLPNSYQPLHIESEIDDLKNLHHLNLATNYNMTQTLTDQSPLSISLPSSITFVKLDIQFQIDNADHVFDFLSDLYKLDRIYYIDSLSMNFTNPDNIIVNIVIYTFYNHID